MQLPEKKYIASFDIDAQNTFTPVCPDELPVAEGDTIAPELNAQAQIASQAVSPPGPDPPAPSPQPAPRFSRRAQPLRALDQRR